FRGNTSVPATRGKMDTIKCKSLKKELFLPRQGIASERRCKPAFFRGVGVYFVFFAISNDKKTPKPLVSQAIQRFSSSLYIVTKSDLLYLPWYQNEKLSG